MKEVGLVYSSILEVKEKNDNEKLSYDTFILSLKDNLIE